MLADAVPKEPSEDLYPVVAIARAMSKGLWMRVDKVLTGYKNAYDALFKFKKRQTLLIEFLRGSPARFFSHEDCISSIDHAIENWHSFNQSWVWRRVKYVRFHVTIGTNDPNFVID